MSCCSGGCGCGKGERSPVQEQLFFNQLNTGTGMLATHDWMKDLQNLKLEKEVIEVRFKNNRKEFFRNNRLLGLKKDDRVVVDAEGGQDVGTVSLTGALARKQYDKKGGGSKISTLNGVYRIAREPDLEKWLEAKKKERPALLKCREMAASLKLAMSIGDVEFRGDGKKLTIFLYSR